MVYGKNVNFLLIKNSIDNSIIALYKLANGGITNIFNYLSDHRPLFQDGCACFNFYYLKSGIFSRIALDVIVNLL